MKRLSLLALAVVFVSATWAQKVESGALVKSVEYEWSSWGNNRLPTDSGLTLSKEFGGVSFTGRYASYTHADTWYLTSASNGAMYSSYTDGSVNGEPGWSPNPRCAKVVGSDPLDLRVSVVGEGITHSGENGAGGKFKFGRYPAAQLIYNDIWYYGTYLLEWTERAMLIPNRDWQVLQPFVGFRVSGDLGENWYDRTEPDDPLLENAHEKWVDAHNVEFNKYEVMIGAPHFVDFGDNLKYAPTDSATGRKWAYMVAHGADAGCDIAHNTWVSGDNIYLLRILMPEGRDVESNAKYINSAENWQYLAKDGTYKSWNRDNLQEVYANIKPIVDATGYLGNVGVTYNAPLKKYIMTLSRVSETSRDNFHTLILEADTIDGEYRVVQYLRNFASQSYFMNIPSRFISDDGRTMWLCYSSNYGYASSPKATIGGSRYALCLTEITLDGEESQARKYEAEGMICLGATSVKVDKWSSNGANVGDISFIGDGVEFYSKSSGNALGVLVTTSNTASKQLSVYVNDKIANRLIIQPAGEEECERLQYVPVEVNYGDKVALKVDEECVTYNRLYGCDLRNLQSQSENDYRKVGEIDYVVIDNVDFYQGELLRKGGESYFDAELFAEEDGEQSLIVGYTSAVNGREEERVVIPMSINKKPAAPITVATLHNPAEDYNYSSVVVPVTLKKGKNRVRFALSDVAEKANIVALGLTSERIKSVLPYVDLAADGSLDATSTKYGGGACTMNVHKGYTGNGFVAGLDAAGREVSVSFVPNIESGKYEFAIRYSAGLLSGTTLNDKRLLTLSVGDKKYQLELPLTLSWQEWTQICVEIDYEKGDLIKLSADRLADTDDCINIDKFIFSQVE